MIRMRDFVDLSPLSSIALTLTPGTEWGFLRSLAACLSDTLREVYRDHNALSVTAQGNTHCSATSSKAAERSFANWLFYRAPMPGKGVGS